jgi:competence protein ComEA
MLRTIATAILTAFTLVVSSSVALATPAVDATTPQATKPAPPAPALVNLNTATAAALEKLPGVGPATATRIVEYREKNGAFKKIEDVMNVRGIGEKTFLNLKPLITVAPPKGGGTGTPLGRR